MRRLPWPALLAFLVAVLAHLSARSAFWNLDDWGFLGRAAGVVPTSTFPARAVSQIFYWKLLYPVLGLDPSGYCWSRLFLHGANAALVALIAARCRVAFTGQLLAGLVFAVCQQSFEPLFWASGVQELLGAFGALVATERWLAGGRRNRWIAVGFCALSILSKENGLGLPLLWIGFALWGPSAQEQSHSREVWLQIAIVTGIALLESILLVSAFQPAPGKPYAMGVGPNVLTNLGLCATWMLTVGLRIIRDAPMGVRVAGVLFWLLWAEVAWRRWRAGDRRPAALLAACLLSLAPVLLLKNHAYVYYAYLAMGALAIALAMILPARLMDSRLAVLVLTLLALLWGRSTFEFRLNSNAMDGPQTENLVRRSTLSCRAATALQKCAPLVGGPLVLFVPNQKSQSSAGNTQASVAADTGSMKADVLYASLGGDIGPRLLLGGAIPVTWMNDFSRAPATAFVLASIDGVLQPWGPLPRALRCLALSDVGSGRLRQAREHLVQAMAIDADPSFACQQAFLPCPLDAVWANAGTFLTELGDGPETIEFHRMLSRCAK